MSQEKAVVAVEMYKLRELLWLRHGCPISSLYGDDGEMQCAKCHIDFKRDSVDSIELAFYENNQKSFSLEVKM